MDPPAHSPSPLPDGRVERKPVHLGDGVVRTRVLIGQGTPIQQAIVRDVIAAAPDMKLVGTGPAWLLEHRRAGEEWLRRSVDRLRPDFLIVEGEGEDLGEPYGELLASHPGLRVLGISPGGRDVVLHELSRRVPIGEASGPALLATIRTHGSAFSGEDTRRTYWHRWRSGGRRHLVGTERGERKMHMMRMGNGTTTQGRPLGGGRRQTLYRTGGPWAVPSTGGEIEVAPASPAWLGLLRPAPSTAPTIVSSVGGLLNAVITQFQSANFYSGTARLIDEVAEQVRDIPPVTFASLVRDFTDTVGGLLRAVGEAAEDEPQVPLATVIEARQALARAWNELIVAIRTGAWPTTRPRPSSASPRAKAP
jgi:hypothetical protein